MTRQFTWRSAVMGLGLTLAAAGTARANGYEFFTPLGDRSKIDLIYVGQIREKGSRNLIRDAAYVMVREKQTDMTFPFDSDRPGHFTSPDVGAAIKELGGNVSPGNLEIQVSVPGYKTATVSKVPRTVKGIVEVNFELEREGDASAASVPTSARPADSAPAGTSEGPSRLWLFGVTALVVIGGIAARTLGPRPSTAR